MSRTDLYFSQHDQRGAQIYTKSVIFSKDTHMPWFAVQQESITQEQIRECCKRLLEEARARFGRPPKRVLLLPPDLTRAHSGAGKVTEMLYNALPDAHV